MPFKPPTHKPAGWKPWIETKKDLDKQRGTAHQRGYGSKWQRARLVFLSNNPLCIHCYQANRITAANVVDHIKPHKGNQALFWDESNWQPLCTHCHNLKTSREDGGFGFKGGAGSKPTA